MRAHSRLFAPVASAVLVLALRFAPPAAAQPGAGAAPAPGPAATSAAAGRCGVCHPAERVLFDKSSHAAEEVRCTSCHGGDDRSLEKAAAHGAGFRGRPTRPAIVKLCASCHSDDQRMHPYDLPVDQYALYQISGHGRRLAQGDTRVAVCSDCHGAHDILPPSDPASRVFSLNIPKTCGTCHADSTLMASRGKHATYAQYMSSVHARELFDRGNPRAPTCVSCHGVHGAAPPSVGDVDKVCGHCHTAERRYFLAGAHRGGFAGNSLPECASCHGDHAIQASQPQRLETVCGQCHGANSTQEKLGRKLWTEYRTASLEIEAASALVEQADRIPIQTADYRARLEEAKTYLREALPAAHGVEEQVVLGLTLRARSVGQEVESEIHGKLGNLRVRKFVLILFWFYVLLTLVVLRRSRNRVTRQG